MRPWAGSRHSICSSVSARRHGVHPAQPGVGSGYHLRPDGPGFFLRRGRSKEVVDEVLGESFGGILVSDFYASYDHYPGLKQRCWAHMLRDIHKLKVLYPEDGGLTQWALGVQRLYAKGREWAAAGGRPPSRGQLALEDRLLALCRPFLEDPLAVQTKLCRRIERHIKELFVFVSHPETPSNSPRSNWESLHRRRGRNT